MSSKAMTRRTRDVLQTVGGVLVVVAAWFVLTAAQTADPMGALSLMLQAGQLLGTGVLVFACGRWAGDLRAKHEALAERVARIERHEDTEGV